MSDNGAPPAGSGKLSKAGRQERIVAELRAGPTLRVSELATTLGVSTETIRRDLDELEARGLINRTYGGAVRPFGPEPTIRERHQMLVSEREIIAVAAARTISHGDVLIIGGGATTTHVARRLAAEKRDLKVFTDSFAVATVLAPNPTVEVFLCPGRYNGQEGCVSGAETIDYIGKIYANHAILGATGLTEDGPNDADIDAAATYRAMALRATDVTVVADHTKFDRAAISVYCRWPAISRLVTDQRPEGALRLILERAGVEVIVP
ncbi:DeoR family transcriptional regulator [Rhodospirillum rubrum]|uniref:DeoR/GlpR family DNA-binding transcription regulator n=1 Tax=Rhodospirillum rubrum TaxID=1085 RepID=UPI0019070DFF|nr:DeoR/GlpR family DNA-binding transcription regulator [Rhodospirillum rubrum]MBK1664453.1 DeoR family transcriptional regulator [Rhodospirillum rubrum]MBK1676159.1 DeoR family transcriptional regulator [Rhodospirillum rubrum]